ncbi:MAG: hypothetical protein V5A20_01290 [Salinibacter sp.]|jgi:hypothetical protein|uniref:hypothetical protein n=1 Tax=Salinibacter sp. TaxID=2065818 RepID=UPI002FC33BB3
MTHAPPSTDDAADQHYRTWKTLAPLGLLATGLGASGVGQSTLLKGRDAPTWKWVAAGTASLVALNAGLCLFGDAVKHRALYEWSRKSEGTDSSDGLNASRR